MGWRKGFCYWFIASSEAFRVPAAVRKHEPAKAFGLLFSKESSTATQSEVEALRKQLAAAESRAASAEASLASQVKESALEIEDLRKRNAALEEDVHRRLGHHDGMFDHVPLGGKCYDPFDTSYLRAPPASPSPARRATAPRRRRNVQGQQITGKFPDIPSVKFLGQSLTYL
jgi:hypothetical protein